MSYGNFVTLMFDLTGTANQRQRKLNETASGLINSEKINLTRIEGGNIIDKPHAAFAANGILSADKLSLRFEPGKTEKAVRDGFSRQRQNRSGKSQII